MTEGSGPQTPTEYIAHHLGFLGITEVQAVGETDRKAAGCDDVPARFRHREHRALFRVQALMAGDETDDDREDKALAQRHLDVARADVAQRVCNVVGA